MTIWFSEIIQQLENSFFDFFFNFISFLGEDYIFIVILGTVYWLYNKNLGKILAFTLAFSAVTNNTLKEIFDFSRPFEKYPDRIINKRPETSTGSSFPSGHTQNFAAVYAMLAIKIKSKTLTITVSIFIVLMALSRIYLGVHFLEDVVFAIVIGVGLAILINQYFNKYHENIELYYRIVLSILIVFTIILMFMRTEDYFKSYGILTGIVFALIFEKKYVNFGFEVSNVKKFIRLTLGIVILLSIQMGLKEFFLLFADEYQPIFLWFDLIRYFLIAFVGFGLYPYLFTKYHF